MTWLLEAESLRVGWPMPGVGAAGVGAAAAGAAAALSPAWPAGGGSRGAARLPARRCAAGGGALAAWPGRGACGQGRGGRHPEGGGDGE